MSKSTALTEADLEALLRLRQNEAGWMGWEEFASLPRSQAGRDARGRLARLREAGYEFEEHPSYGLRLIQAPERLIAEEISFRLETQIIGRRIITLGETTSTMDVARGLAEKGAEEGLVVFAEFQSAGRGRLGRHWLSPPHKDLLFSVILRPEAASRPAAHTGVPDGWPARAGRDGRHLFTITAAVAVALMIREAQGLPALIRWPNDVIIKDKKVAGMLVESASQGAWGSFHILGVGLNVNTSEEDFPKKIKKTATSLRIEKGAPAGGGQGPWAPSAPLDRTLMARKILKYLDRLILISLENEVEEIGQAWRDLSSILGGRVKLLEEGKEFAGRVLDLSPEEGIMLELDSGAQRLFRSEEVTLLTSMVNL